MKKIICMIFVGLVAVCSGCARSIQTDPVRFCRTFNAQNVGLHVREENVYRRMDTEYLLYAGNILLRLCTNEAQTIHTVILTAKADQTLVLRQVAENAFTVLSDTYAEDVPQTVLTEIRSGECEILETKTKHFLYILFRSPESVTVQQVNLHLCEIPSQPAVHPSKAASPSADRVSPVR